MPLLSLDTGSRSSHEPPRTDATQRLRARQTCRHQRDWGWAETKRGGPRPCQGRSTGEALRGVPEGPTRELPARVRRGSQGARTTEGVTEQGDESRQCPPLSQGPSGAKCRASGGGEGNSFTLDERLGFDLDRLDFFTLEDETSLIPESDQMWPGGGAVTTLLPGCSSWGRVHDSLAGASLLTHRGRPSVVFWSLRLTRRYTVNIFPYKNVYNFTVNA